MASQFCVFLHLILKVTETRDCFISHSVAEVLLFQRSLGSHCYTAAGCSDRHQTTRRENLPEQICWMLLYLCLITARLKQTECGSNLNGNIRHTAAVCVFVYVCHIGMSVSHHVPTMLFSKCTCTCMLHRSLFLLLRSSPKPFDVH